MISTIKYCKKEVIFLFIKHPLVKIIKNGKKKRKKNVSNI